jgi:hypothetical protein
MTAWSNEIRRLGVRDIHSIHSKDSMISTCHNMVNALGDPQAVGIIEVAFAAQADV